MAEDRAGLRRLGPTRGPVPTSWLQAPAPTVAQRLLGALVVRREPDGSETVVRLVETEAYRESDPASHSFRGLTPRTATMFGPPGHAYVYFTYGMHHCVNVTCEDEHVGAAVLLRAGIALTNHELIRRRRGHRPRDRELLAGPGRLTQALAIDRDLNGTAMLDPRAGLRLESDGFRPSPDEILVGPRVGVRQAADVPWRFHLGVVEASRYARHPRAPR